LNNVENRETHIRLNIKPIGMQHVNIKTASLSEYHRCALHMPGYLIVTISKDHDPNTATQRASVGVDEEEKKNERLLPATISAPAVRVRV